MPLSYIPTNPRVFKMCILCTLTFLLEFSPSHTCARVYVCRCVGKKRSLLIFFLLSRLRATKYVCLQAPPPREYDCPNAFAQPILLSSLLSEAVLVRMVESETVLVTDVTSLSFYTASTEMRLAKTQHFILPSLQLTCFHMP